MTFQVVLTRLHVVQVWGDCEAITWTNKSWTFASPWLTAATLVGGVLVATHCKFNLNLVVGWRVQVGFLGIVLLRPSVHVARHIWNTITSNRSRHASPPTFFLFKRSRPSRHENFYMNLKWVLLQSVFIHNRKRISYIINWQRKLYFNNGKKCRLPMHLTNRRGCHWSKKLHSGIVQTRTYVERTRGYKMS